MSKRQSIARPLKRRSVWLAAGCSTAIAMAGMAEPAFAQSFQGSGNVVEGLASISTAANYTQVVLDTPETVIEWGIFDLNGVGTVDFQPAGTTMEFVNGANVNDFTVLNRILPTDEGGIPTARPISLDGTVSSIVNNGPGGNVWIYSPTGIIVGANANFSVGGLILTTNDILFGASNTGGSTLFGPAGEIYFRGPADSTSFVQIDSGAVISAIANSSYLGVVAPRIVQNGQASVDGPIAYVAAEQADLTINAGLFDIQILQGTTDSNGLVHGGVTGGPASAGPADVQTIQMVALPKNTALTMLLGGSIGYATAASPDGSAIVLSAGYASDAPAAAAGNALGNIEIGNSVFGNPVTGYASNTVTVDPAGGTAQFVGNADFVAETGITLNADAGDTIQADANLTLRSGLPGAGGSIVVTAPGGTISTVGTFQADASSNPLNFATPVLGDQSGGSVLVQADGGLIQFDFALLDTSGYGLSSLFANPPSGTDGFGGDITFDVLNGGTISASQASIFAQGSGGASEIVAGDGFGGTITILDRGGTLAFGTVYADVSAYGGSSEDIGVLAGSGNSGSATVDISGQAQSWDALFLVANSFGGFANVAGALAGSAFGAADAASLAVSGPGGLAILGDLSLSANAIVPLEGQAGYQGSAGGVTVSVTGGAALQVTNDIYLNADAVIDSDSTQPGNLTSPFQSGGIARLDLDNGSLSARSLFVSTIAETVGAATDPGTATGGSAGVSLTNGSLLTLDNTGLLDHNLLITANAQGGPGPLAGHAFGGDATLAMTDSDASIVGTVAVTANALGGSFYSTFGFDGDGHDATGGTALVDLVSTAPGTNSLAAEALFLEAEGDARAQDDPTAFLSGNSGIALGGSANFASQGTDVRLSDLIVSADAFGGRSDVFTSLAYQSGDATGGSAGISIIDASAAIATQVLASASGYGGGAPDPTSTVLSGALASVAGDGSGGSAGILLGGSADLTTTTLTSLALGQGGQGWNDADGDTATDGGSGGAGTGGQALLGMAAGSTGSITSTSTLVDASGLGGLAGTSDSTVSGNGGDGTGGSATADLADGGFALGPLSLLADGVGQGGQLHGAATGGTAVFSLTDTLVGPRGTRTIDSLAMSMIGNAAGISAVANTVAAGSGSFAVSALDPAAAPDIAGNLSVATGLPSATPVSGDFAFALSGAPLGVGGSASFLLHGDGTFTSADAQTLQVAGTFDFQGSSLTSNLVIDAGVISILALGSPGINATTILSGSTTSLTAQAGPVVIASLTSPGFVSLLAGSADIASPGSLSFDTATTLAGDLLVTTAGDLAMDGATVAGLLDTVSGGATTLTGTTTADAVAIDAGSSIAADTILSGGTTALAAPNGPVTVTSLTSPGLVSLLAGSADITSPGSLSFDTATTLAGDLLVSTAGDLALATASVAGLLDLASGGAVSLTGTTTADAIAIDAGSSLAAATMVSNGTTSLNAPNGPVTIDSLEAAGPVSLLAASADVASPGSLSFDTATTLAGDLLVTTAGDLAMDGATVSGLLDTISGGATTLTGPTTADAIAIDAAGDLSILGALSSAQTIELRSGATADIQAAVLAADITLAAADIALGPAGQIGGAGTTANVLLINADPTRETHIGGAGSVTSAFTVDETELNRIFADQRLTITTEISSLPAGASGDFVIDTLTMDWLNGNIGPGGTLEILAPELLRVIGSVTLAVRPTDTFRLAAGDIHVVTDSGSLSLRDGSGNLAGVLDLAADNVIVASSALLPDILAGGSLADISALLDVNDGPVSDAGTIAASSVDVAVAESFYVQNSGSSDAYDDRRGFTVSTNTLSINTTGAQTRIAVNGQAIDANGDATRGLSTVSTVLINGAPAGAGGLFDPLSTINGCVIGTDCTFVPPPPPPPPPAIPEIGNIPDTETELTGVFPGPVLVPPGSAPIVTEVRDPLGLPPLVDEPITGVGNDDLWNAPCAEAGNCEAAEDSQ